MPRATRPTTMLWWLSHNAKNDTYHRWQPYQRLEVGVVEKKRPRGHLGQFTRYRMMPCGPQN